MTTTIRRTSKPQRLVQISFKVAPEIAEQLDERAMLIGVSRHCVARSLVDGVLSRNEAPPEFLAGARPGCESLDISGGLKAIEDRIGEVVRAYDQLCERFTHQERRLANAQQDFANGVFAMLVQTGKSPEHAEAFVRSHLHLPPKGE